jgi:hypothetical protein
MLGCPNRSYLVRYTVILVISRDCNHITWSRNSASVSLLAIFRSNRSTNRLINTFRLSNSYHSSTSRIQSFRNQSFRNYERKHQNDFFIRNNEIEKFFRVSNMTNRDAKSINFHESLTLRRSRRVSSSTILIVEISIEKNLNVFVISSTLKKIRKFRIDNLKTITIIRNQLKCNDRDLLKNEINVIKTWQIFKKSFSSCESKILNNLFIKLWIIILIIN